jgi:hypothetical protein
VEGFPDVAKATTNPPAFSAQTWYGEAAADGALIAVVTVPLATATPAGVVIWYKRVVFGVVAKTLTMLPFAKTAISGAELGALADMTVSATMFVPNVVLAPEYGVVEGTICGAVMDDFAIVPDPMVFVLIEPFTAIVEYTKGIVAGNTAPTFPRPYRYT